MKQLLTLLIAVGITASVFAQAPNSMSYQAVVRDAGNLLVTTPVGMQISILQGSDTGTAVYVETQTPTPNINGLVSLKIGDGTLVSGDITSIDWTNGPYFIKTETDPTGGTSYTITGTSQIMSVPYALHAKTADNVTGVNLQSVLTSGNDAGTNSIVNVNQLGLGITSPSFIMDAVGTNGPRLRVFSQDNFFAGLLAKNNSHEYFVGIQGTFEAADGVNSGFQVYDNTAGAQRMVIDASGNIGINNSSPLYRLDIIGDIKIADGTQGAGKVLTSDALGKATWQTPSGGSSLIWQGAWVSQEYVVDDVVEYNGSSYVCILNTTFGQEPADVTYWDLLAAKGGVYDGTSSSNLDWTQLETDCAFDFLYTCTGTSVATLTTNEPLFYTPGMRVRVTSATDVTAFFDGVVQTYSALVMTILLDNITSNFGPTNDWVINLGAGLNGVPGPYGEKGEDGKSAAECFDYNFDSSTSNSPFDGTLRFNSSDLSTSTQIYIHNNDNNSFNQLDYFNLIKNNLSTIKGTIMVSQDDFGTNNWSLFAINSVTDNTGYQTLDVSYLSGVTTPFTDFNPIAVCFGRTGDKGDSGVGDAKNILGSIGVTDPASDIANPNEGDQWVNNETGESFIYQNGVWDAVPSSFQLTDNTDDTSTTSFEGTSTNIINPPATDGIFVWNQDVANGVWIAASLDNSKNFIGTGPAPIEGGNAIVSGMDRDPIEGDEWSSSINGETFIFQNGQWNAIPSSSGFTDTFLTTNSITTTITTISTSSDMLYYVESKVLAKRTDSPGEAASFKITSTVLNNAGTLTLLGTTTEIMDSGTSTWTAGHQVSGSDLILRVTGEVAKTIDWKSVTEIIEN